jgi:hypothetical protein
MRDIQIGYAQLLGHRMENILLREALILMELFRFGKHLPEKKKFLIKNMK